MSNHRTTMADNNPSTSSSSTASFERRLARIEQSLERVEQMFSQLTEQKDAMLGLAGDVLDRGESNPASRDERIRGVATLAREISEPAATQAMSSALRVLPDLQGGLSTGLDVLDQIVRDEPQLADKLTGLLGLLKRVAEPHTIRTIEAGLDTLDQASDLVGTILDLADQQVRQWQERHQAQGSSVENIAANVGQLMQWLSLDSTRQFLSKELSDSSSVQALAFLADSVRSATEHPPKAVGLFKSARKLGHADSQFALGFVCDLVEQLGRNLSQRSSSNRHLLKQEN